MLADFLDEDLTLDEREANPNREGLCATVLTRVADPVDTRLNGLCGPWDAVPAPVRSGPAGGTRPLNLFRHRNLRSLHKRMPRSLEDDRCRAGKDFKFLWLVQRCFNEILCQFLELHSA